MKKTDGVGDSERRIEGADRAQMGLKTGASQDCCQDPIEPSPLKSYKTILEQEIDAGLLEFERPNRGLLLSSFSAGLDTGFSVLLMAVFYTLFQGQLDDAWLKLLLASCYSVGFLLVILGRSELFTEHTTLAVLPVLDKQKRLIDLARVWGVVYAGNISGAVLFSAIMCFVTPQMGIVDERAFVALAEPLVQGPFWVIFLSAVLAGWLMGELGWLIGAARDTISQVVFVFIVTATIGAVGLHHSIVGTVEVVAGVIVSQGEIGLVDFAKFLFWTTFGNAVGGVVFVAMIKYGHANHAGDEG